MSQTVPVAEAFDLSMAYRLPHNRARSLKEFSIRKLKRQVHYEQLWALQDVSIQVLPGEVLAVVGDNGAGKTTLLKLITRVLPPTQGRLIVRGSVAPLIDVAAGFDMELTAEENIVLYGTLLGRPPSAMRQRVRTIAEWAEVETLLDVPLRTFSSGMLARLGFAVATDTNPHLLVIDEVLAVGDQAFRMKSRARIEQLISEGSAVILVSHDLDSIAELASSALWLDRGRAKAQGPANEVVEAYRERA